MGGFVHQPHDTLREVMPVLTDHGIALMRQLLHWEPLKVRPLFCSPDFLSRRRFCVADQVEPCVEASVRGPRKPAPVCARSAARAPGRDVRHNVKQIETLHCVT